MTRKIESDLLTPAEVALMFRVDSKTVTRWADAGMMTYMRTLGGHRRFREEDIRQLMADRTVKRAESA